MIGKENICYKFLYFDFYKEKWKLVLVNFYVEFNDLELWVSCDENFNKFDCLVILFFKKSWELKIERFFIGRYINYNKDW